MKTTFFTFLLFLAGNACIAQTVLTKNDLAPQVGDGFYYLDADFEAPTDTGQGVVWDYSNLQVYSGPFYESTLAYTQPDTLQGQSSLQLKLAGFTSFEASKYYSVTDSTLEEVLYTDNGGGLLEYSNARTELFFPLYYGAEWYDTVIGTSTHPASGTQYRNAQIHFIVDGEGTLILPSDTYTGVLRLKKTTLSTGSYPGSTQVDSSHVVQYYYYSPGLRNYLMQQRIAEGDTTSGMCHVFIQETTGIESSFNEGEIALYPNPSNQGFRIDVGNSGLIEFDVDVYDNQGRTVVRRNGVTNDEYFETAILPKGIYLVKIVKDGLVIKLYNWQFNKVLT